MVLPLAPWLALLLPLPLALWVPLPLRTLASRIRCSAAQLLPSLQNQFWHALSQHSPRKRFTVVLCSGGQVDGYAESKGSVVISIVFSEQLESPTASPSPFQVASRFPTATPAGLLNDMYADAIEPSDGSTVGATREVGEPVPGFGASASIWYKVEVPAGATHVSVRSCDDVSRYPPNP